MTTITHIPAGKTRRDELSELLDLMGNEQADALDELLEYLITEPVQEFRRRLSIAHEKTIPSTMFESALANTFTVLDALMVVLPQARASLAPVQETPADTAPVPTPDGEQTTE